MGRSLGFGETATAATLLRSVYESYIIPLLLSKMTNAALKNEILNEIKSHDHSNVLT